MKAWIDHPVEPRSLLLAWQAPEGQKDRLRWAIGVIQTTDPAVFRYFDADELPKYNARRSLEALTAAGFVGYPAFPFRPGSSFVKDILPTFVRRLPPSSREDFGQYQEYFSIHPGTAASAFLLLAVTEARLPGDGFSIVDPLDPTIQVGDAVVEIAGYRYEASGCSLEVGDSLTLEPDPANEHDPNAIAVYQGTQRVGFVNRLQALTVGQWLSTRIVRCEVIRKNGRTDAPRAYAKVSVRPKSENMAA